MHGDTQRIVRRLHGVALGLTLPLGACSSDLVGPTAAEFDELCGEKAPLRLLAVDADRVPNGVGGRAYGDRYVFALAFGFGEDFADRELEFWSVGHCGEDPVRLLASGNFLGLGPTPGFEFPMVWDYASETSLVLDPSGVRPPHAPFAVGTSSWNGYTRHGLVNRFGEGDTGPLVLQRWPNDPLTEVAEQVVLLDDARFGRSRLKTQEDDLLALTADDELVAVSLVDLEVRVLAEGVNDFDTGLSQRFILWQGLDLVEDDFGELVVGPLFLLDRESGESRLVDDGAQLFTSEDVFSLEALGLLHYRQSGLPHEETRVLRLDTLELAASLPPHLVPWWGRVDDTRAVLRNEYYDVPLQVFDGSTGELTPLPDAHIARQDWMGTYDPGTGPSIFWIHNDGALLDLNLTTGQTRTLANRVSRRWAFISGGRVVTSIGVGDDGVGSLVIVNPDTLAEMYIDHNVLSGPLMLLDQPGTHPSGPGTWSPIGQVSTSDAVSYLVVDADPERQGIWLAKPAK